MTVYKATVRECDCECVHRDTVTDNCLHRDSDSVHIVSATVNVYAVTVWQSPTELEARDVQPFEQCRIRLVATTRNMPLYRAVSIYYTEQSQEPALGGFLALP